MRRCSWPRRFSGRPAADPVMEAQPNTPRAYRRKTPWLWSRSFYTAIRAEPCNGSAFRPHRRGENALRPGNRAAICVNIRHQGPSTSPLTACLLHYPQKEGAAKALIPGPLHRARPSNAPTCARSLNKCACNTSERLSPFSGASPAPPPQPETGDKLSQALGWDVISAALSRFCHTQTALHRKNV